MKILLTGFTQRMINSRRLIYDYLTSVYLLRAALEQLGHTVEHRVVTWGEDLTGYDLALVGVGPPRSFTARHVPGAAWAHQELPTIFYADDWSVVNLGSSVNTTMRNWNSYLKFLAGLGQPDLSVAATQGVQHLLTALVTDRDAILLAPMFPWGNHQLLREGNFAPKLAAWDPTPLVMLPPAARSAAAVSGEAKQRRWINATLQKHDDWVKTLQLSWPVETLGNRRAGQVYLSETHVIQLYRESWGVLCPRYARAGSGWWRVRYHWAALTGAVLLADRADTGWMNTPHQVSGRHVESLAMGELASLAKAQHDWFFSATASRDATLTKLRRLVDDQT